MSADIRWKQRFQNYERAFLLLREAFEKDLATMSSLEKEGLIQRFEYTYELAWKTMKDYMEDQGVVFDQITPRRVIKEAFSAKIIEDGQGWIDMMIHRNKLSHIYQEVVFKEAVHAIRDKYFSLFDTLYELLKEASVK